MKLELTWFSYWIELDLGGGMQQESKALVDTKDEKIFHSHSQTRRFQGSAMA